jgi:hypothetical protein
VVDNQGRLPLSYGLQDFQLVDSKGATHRAEDMNGAGWLAGGAVDPGKHLMGTVTFLMAKDDPAPVVTFSPRSLRAIMRWSAAPPAA